MKPICVPCRRFFRLNHTGFRFTEGMPNGRYLQAGSTPAGNDTDEWWQPYKLWRGDLYKCEGCGAEIIVGVAKSPAAERHMEYFSKARRDGGYDQFQVNDC